jgi:ABC-type lipoprotein release transport system permease subunit
MYQWFEKQRFFIDFTLSSLLRRKWKNASLLLVYTIMVFLVSSVIFFTEAIRKEAQLVLSDAPQMVVQKMIGGRFDLIPIHYSDEIREIRGVQSVTPRLWGYYFDSSVNANYTVQASGEFNLGDNEVIVGNGVARSRLLATGDRVALRASNGETIIVKVKDTLSSSSELVSSDLIITNETTLRKLLGIPQERVTDLALEIRRKEELVTIARKIVSLYPDTRPILRDEILRTYSSVFDWRSGIVIIILCGSVLAFFIFAWDKATGLSAEEKKEIGILKALGWDTSDILIIKFWEGTVISLTAFFTGVTAGYIHVFFASSGIFQYALKGWSVLYPDFKLIPTFGLYQITLLFFLSVLPYTLTTIIPAWKVAITDPDSVMRQ